MNAGLSGHRWCEIGLSPYGLLFRARVLGSPQDINIYIHDVCIYIYDIYIYIYLIFIFYTYMLKI